MFQMGVREIGKGITANTKAHTHTPRFPPNEKQLWVMFFFRVRACSGTLIRNRQFFLFLSSFFSAFPYLLVAFSSPNYLSGNELFFEIPCHNDVLLTL